MRIALVSEHASPLAFIGGVDGGGQNVHLAELAAGLVRLGHRVVVYTRRESVTVAARITTSQGYDVVHLTAGPTEPVSKDDLWPYIPAFADQLRRDLELDRPDAVHAHFWMSGWAALRAARHLGLPVAVTFHALGTVKQRHQGAADTSPSTRLQVEAGVARGADRVIATCSDEVRELVRLGVPTAQISVVPCGVDVEHFDPDAAPGAVPPGGPRTTRYRLVSVGRLVPRKGFGTIIEALAKLPATELIVAGGSSDADPASDPEGARLLRLARRHGVADRVRLIGPVARDAMPALLRSADVVVCAPWYEPFGLVPLEAMACGVPVVGSAVGGLLDTVTDGETGLLVPARNPRALAAALHALLRNPARRVAFGRAGRARALRQYSWDRVSIQTATAYAALAQGCTPEALAGRTA